MDRIMENKAELLAKRDELFKRLQAIEADYKRGLSADSEERATELENAEVLDGIARVAAEELQRVEAALKALEE